MSSSGSSSAWNRQRKKAVSPSSSLAPRPAGVVPSLPPPLPVGTLPLVPFPCCGVRRTIRLVSSTIANPGRVFYKCPNHHVSCNVKFHSIHVLWPPPPELHFLLHSLSSMLVSNYHIFCWISSFHVSVSHLSNRATLPSTYVFDGPNPQKNPP